jgi:hypothetical protein
MAKVFDPPLINLTMAELKHRLASSRYLSGIEDGEKKIHKLLDELDLRPAIYNRRSFKISMSFLAMAGMSAGSIAMILICYCCGCCLKCLTFQHPLLKPRWPRPDPKYQAVISPNETSTVSLTIPRLSTNFTQFDFEQFRDWFLDNMSNRLERVKLAQAFHRKLSR